VSAAAEHEKAVAATRALDFVKPGMKLGIGTGSTAEHFIRQLGERVQGGLKLTGVPTSKRTEALARQLGIPLAELDDVDRLDVTVDGADEVDHELRLIKGGGGALLREKIVAAASDCMVVIADSSKYVASLGAFPLPIEIAPFAHRTTARCIQAEIGAFIVGATAAAKLRRTITNTLFTTDGGNYILDVACGTIDRPEALARFLSDLPGVVEHGLFIGLARTIVIGRGDQAEVIEAKETA
jgi:ribose 5-phosphate isomerase A